MSTITYTELIRRVPLWMMAQNRDLVAEMPAVVAQGHDQLVGILDHDLFKVLLPSQALALTGLVDLSAVTPPVFEVRALALPYKNGQVPLVKRTLQTLQALFPRPKPGRPRYYAEHGDPLKFLVFPPPAVATTVIAEVNQEPPVLSPTQDTNVMSVKAPRAVEKATMRQAALFMKEWDTADRYEKEMMAAVMEANSQAVRHRRDEAGTRPVDTANRVGV